jgi:hypothetical protein
MPLAKRGLPLYTICIDLALEYFALSACSGKLWGSCVFGQTAGSTFRGESHEKDECAQKDHAVERDLAEP